MSRPIEDYALLGDCETAALVACDGSIDWLCWPRFDSEACFAALLGGPEHGHWRITADEEAVATRRYRPDTLILETEFTTARGAVRLVDFMPVQRSHSSVVRILVGISGSVSIRFDAMLRFDYGRIRPRVIRHTGDETVAMAGPIQVAFRGSIPLDVSADRLGASFTIFSGQTLAFSMTCGSSAEATPPSPEPHIALQAAEIFWRKWVGQFDQTTQWPAAVKRSLITLKALIYRPTGGLIAAPSMALPERLGGSLNWDYRYCWLRDSTFALTALLNAGFRAEATSSRDWIVRTVGGSPEKLQVAYRTDGDRSLSEEEIPWLPGYDASRPVRKGNAAAAQRQLDIFGEVVDALHLARLAGLPPAQGEFELWSGLLSYLEQIWQQPDKGLWESRGPSQDFTYSRVMAWVAVDRFIKAGKDARRFDPTLLERIRNLADVIHGQICRDAYDAERGCFVHHYGSREVDGSLLLLPLVGFLPCDDPRIQGTIATVQRDLMEGGLVLRRKVASTGEKEGAFIACTCWLADCLAMQGRTGEATTLLERVLGLRNDVGLLSEEYDVDRARLVGNFPQALSHLAVINSAIQLSGPVLQRGGG